ncbi:hypothetical protein RUM44_001255 [Polyplax serrata]|uniref:G-protein coupled receptors family 3 profile domain-containing protein n=1 Tax=Polyplax serrata TaxID=468196 RepID=A0ABR1AJH5_POLSC
MSYNGHKNLDIYENKQIFMEINCEEENESKKECQCLEVKPDRTESARNIDDLRRKKKQPPKNNLDINKNSSEMFDKGISQFLYQPMVYGSLNDPINGTLACLTLLGGLITLIIAQYFATFAALPNGVLPTGTSVLGYFILLGLFLLYTTNLSFLLTPLVSTCALRRFFIGFSYALVFSGMLIKVWSSLRQITSEKATVTKPFSLLLYAGAFTLIQGLLSGVWLILRPPATDFKADKWICYPPHGPDSHLIFSMIYPLILLVATIILSLQICSKAKNDEARWILISSSLVAIVLCCWAIAIGTRVWQRHRTPCTNLATATILLLCLYVPKIRKHSELKKALKSNITTQSVPAEMDKPCPVYATTPPTIPVFYGYNVMSPPQPVVMSEDIADPNYINQAYSFDESSETASTPFDMDSSSYSELEQEPYKFSTFLEEPRVLTLPQETTLDDPTQMIPSSLYSMDMFNTEPIAITSDHCQPGTNEFTPPHRATSQLYLCPQTEWVTHTDGV